MILIWFLLKIQFMVSYPYLYDKNKLSQMSGYHTKIGAVFYIWHCYRPTHSAMSMKTTAHSHFAQKMIIRLMLGWWALYKVKNKTWKNLNMHIKIFLKSPSFSIMRFSVVSPFMWLIIKSSTENVKFVVPERWVSLT